LWGGCLGGCVKGFGGLKGDDRPWPLKKKISDSCVKGKEKGKLSDTLRAIENTITYSKRRGLKRRRTV